MRSFRQGDPCSPRLSARPYRQQGATRCKFVVFVIGLLMIVGGCHGRRGLRRTVGGEAGSAAAVSASASAGCCSPTSMRPSRRDKLPPGHQRAKATILDAVGTSGSVAGYQMVELTLEVKPKDGLPFQVKRKFSAGKLGRIEPGRRLDVVYDPANPSGSSWPELEARCEKPT